MNYGTTSMIVYAVFIIGFMFVALILPQKRRDKKAREMIRALNVGEEIITIGGICGKVINIKDDEITIESGVKKSQIVVKNWSVKEVKKLIEA